MIGKRSLIVACLCLDVCLAWSQKATVYQKSANYSAVYSVQDCFKNKRYQGGFRPDSLKRNYMLKGTRIWRSVSLENKQNEQLLNTNSGSCSEIGLFEIIKFGIFEKDLRVFSSDNFSEAKLSVLSKEDAHKLVMLNDSSAIPTFDANGEQVQATVIMKKYRMGGDIKSYLLKEDWITTTSGMTEKYIIGIAPLVFDEKSGRTVPLFWLYYPEWKNLFAAFNAPNLYSHEPVTYEEIFRKRYFFSQISKESNVFDRSVKSFTHGDDVYFENQVIKEKLNNSQHDLFQH